MEVQGKIVDLHQREIKAVKITIEKGKIVEIVPNTHRDKGFILPGFIDAHIHLESTLLSPLEFARLSLRHGTIGAICDPLAFAVTGGFAAIEYLIDSAKKTPFKFYFKVPSISASSLETKGATLSLPEIEKLLHHPLFCSLAAPCAQDIKDKNPTLLKAMALARSLEKPIDGYAPFFDDSLKDYFQHGITTDSSCTTLSDAAQKQALGIKILLQQSTLCKHFSSLLPFLQAHPTECMFCTNFQTPSHLLLGHLNTIVKKGVQNGLDLMDLLLATSKNPVDHYGLDIGLLQVGDPADFIIVEDLTSFRVVESYINGECVFNKQSMIPSVKLHSFPSFAIEQKEEKDFIKKAESSSLQVIEATENACFTKSIIVRPKVENQIAISNVEQDILKIAVVNRFQDAPISIGFVKNFGVKKGAIASSISYDCHHLVGVGVTDEDLCEAINAIIRVKGGLAISYKGQVDLLPLPIGGLLSSLPAEELAIIYSNFEEAAKALGAAFTNPFLMLSFMTQLSSLGLKITDQGLIDCKTAAFTPLFLP